MLAMNALRAGLLLPILLLLGLAQEPVSDPPRRAPAPLLALPQEKHLANVFQLTFGGENAEAYFSADDRWLIFQAHEGADACDQIFILPVEVSPTLSGPGFSERSGDPALFAGSPAEKPLEEGSALATEGIQPRRVSAGQGKTTCGYFFPSGDRILYSSTHLAGAACPPRPDYSSGYVWPVYADYDIFTARPDGSELRRLTQTPGYDAEATVSRDGRRIVFTSVRDGDLDIYAMDADGGNVRRLTQEVGYDGGAFFSPDGTQIVYRAHHPTDPAEVAEYQRLLQQNLVRPTRLEIWVMDADGSNKRQVTSNGAANFAPFFHPDGQRIIFASNMADLLQPAASGQAGRRPRTAGAGNFDLYLINLDGTGLERVTFSSVFDGFPMFSSDGKKLVWASNRAARQPGETNIFLADWVE